MMIEKYSKAEIVDAIRVYARKNPNLEIMLVNNINQRRLDRAYADWEVDSSRSSEAVNAYVDVVKNLAAKYGAINPSLMSDRETNSFLRAYKNMRAADEREKQSYKRMKKIEEQINDN